MMHEGWWERSCYYNREEQSDSWSGVLGSNSQKVFWLNLVTWRADDSNTDIITS